MYIVIDGWNDNVATVLFTMQDVETYLANEYEEIAEHSRDIWCENLLVYRALDDAETVSFGTIIKVNLS